MSTEFREVQFAKPVTANQNGKLLKLTYSIKGLLVNRLSSEKSEHWEYLNNGRLSRYHVKQLADPTNGIDEDYAFTYNSKGKISKVKTLNQQISIRYNLYGQPISIVDAINGRILRLKYGSIFGKPTSIFLTGLPVATISYTANTCKIKNVTSKQDAAQSMPT